jgi:hypothetical protein
MQPAGENYLYSAKWHIIISRRENSLLRVKLVFWSCCKYGANGPLQDEI